MTQQINLNKYSIEPLLFLLEELRKRGISAEELAKEVRPLNAQLTLEEQKMQVALGILKFAEEMPGGFFIYRADAGEEILYANKAMLRIFDCKTTEEFLAVTKGSFKGLVHPEDLEEVERSIEEQIRLSRYELDYVEYRIVTKGGEIRWVDDYGHFIHSECAGNVFYVFAGDATEKKACQQREKEILRNSQHEQQVQIDEYDQELEVIHQEHLRHLEMIEGLSIDYESIFYVDLENNRIKAYRVSPRFEREFPKRQSVREFEGFDKEYIRDWVHPDDQKSLEGISTIAFVKENLSAEKTFHINYRVWNQGKVKYIQLRMVNSGGDENLSRVVIGYRNVDEEIIREMQQKQILSDALDKANQANNAKNLFLSNMSHDIRTPMNAIVGLAGLVESRIGENKKVSEYLGGIRQASNQLLSLLNDVLEISRIESGKIFVEEEKANLLEVMEQVQKEQLPKAEAKNMTLEMDISELRYTEVFVDRKKLVQILSYLVDNAIKYTEAGGWAQITVRQEEAEGNYASYQFIVEDNGFGISNDFLSHIFEPFEREKNTTLGGVSGTGLGLPITKHLVEKMGGTITVESKVGEGSRFTVTLPLRIRSKRVCSRKEPKKALLHFAGKKRILIVDDNDINLEIEREVLKAAGFLVDTATDGSIAVEMMEQSKPGYYDLILMDIQMPVMDGHCATRAIRGMNNPIKAGIPIIAVSANTFEEDRRASLESGMNEHLGKPLDIEQLRMQLQKYLVS